MIPDDIIARVRESVNLAELIRESVPGLRKRGRNYQARCPFHEERTPSFSVNAEMGLFKCFGCGVGGDAFKYVMLTEGLNYPEAIKKLASRTGIVIEEKQSEAVSAEGKERQKLYELMEEAARFYHRNLMESPEATEARSYLEKRGVSAQTLTTFSIGFAPASGHAIRDAAVRKGYSTELLEKAGLVRRKEGSDRIHDHLWNRIIFPIWDVQGRIIAFGGRAMGDAMPKYINSPETPIYSKSRHLYGLFQGLATLRKRRHAVILEGYMDVAVCHQFGFDFTSATLGTALTDEHVRLLRRYCERVTLLFDPDSAGIAASVRGGELLVAEGFTVDVVTLPDGLDPDEILIRDGRGALEAQLADRAVPFMDYFLAQTMRRHPGLSPESKLAVAREVLPLVRRIRDPLLQDEHLGRVAETLHADKAILGQQMKRLKIDGTALPAREPVKVVPLTKEFLSLEEELLLLAILYPSETMARALDTLDWIVPTCREAWQALRTSIASSALHLAEVVNTLPEEIQPWLTKLALENRHYPDPIRMLTDLLDAWNRQKENVEMRRLQIEIARMMEGQIPMDAQKVQSYNDLSRRLKGSRPASPNFTEAPSHG